MAEVEIATEALTGTLDLLAAPESLSFIIAIIGPQRSGKNTLVRSLCHQTEHFGPKFLASYFKGNEGSHEVMCHTYPSLPNVTILDYPGYNPGDSSTAYLEGIKTENVHCLVMTVGEVISDADLQLLGALKHLGKPYCVVQTHVDLILHTEKRQQGKNYWRGKTLLGLRGKTEERLGGSGPQGAHIFLVVCLEAQNYDSVEMVDFIEWELLQWKRPVNHTADPKTQELASVFEVQCDQEGLPEFCSLLSIFIDNPPPVSAVVGITGIDKDGILCALCEPPLLGLIVRSLPGPGTPPRSVEQYLQNLQTEACDS